MTGYGEARFQSDHLTLSIELRALNNRYLKISVRAPDPYHLLEAEFEKVIRRQVKRGTLQLQLRCERQSAPQDFRINPVALASYVRQVRELAPKLGLRDREGEGSGDALLSQILMLPGVVPEPGASTHSLHDDWPLIEKVLLEALAQLQVMRQDEGRAMATELLAHRDTIAANLNVIPQPATLLAPPFRDRL